MKINFKKGIDQLLFGMKENDVMAIYGKPNGVYKDEDENTILLYNKQKWRLTFYKEENFKLGYIVASSSDLTFFDTPIINKKIKDLKSVFEKNGLKKYSLEQIDTFENYFYEDLWIIIQTEFDEIVKFEIGAIINDKDEFDWAFNK